MSERMRQRRVCQIGWIGQENTLGYRDADVVYTQKVFFEQKAKGRGNLSHFDSFDQVIAKSVTATCQAIINMMNCSVDEGENPIPHDKIIKQLLQSRKAYAEFLAQPER